MTEARLKTGLWARALMRLVQGQGHGAMLLKKGDEDAGALLIVLTDRQNQLVVLRVAALGQGWERLPMDDASALDAYLERQKRYDPDLWILEITVHDVAEPIETILPGRMA